MVYALTGKQAQSEANAPLLNQLLHGYSEGHRLLEASIDIPDDISRTVLRLSDLSGTNVIGGFEEYITGYPLPSLGAYALAKSWYAPEMPRPGCVWTHTIVIPKAILATIPSLDALKVFFKRPDARVDRSSYAKPIVFKAEAPNQIEMDPFVIPKILPNVLHFHYQNDSVPVILGVRNSRELESLFFALWSQKWPSLRINFTFCTGALSARTYNKRPLDIQCVPVSKLREVLLELNVNGANNTAVGIAEGAETSSEIPPWSFLAAKDASIADGGRLRKFIWMVSDETSKCGDFSRFTIIFDAVDRAANVNDLIAIVAKHFPNPNTGRQVKSVLFGKEKEVDWLPNQNVHDLLLAMGITSDYQAFDCEALALITKAKELSLNDPDKASTLISQLFCESLNPLGEEILAGLVSAIEPETARRLTKNQLHFLPSLFRAKPSLATSSQLWSLAGNRKRDLFEAIASHHDLAPGIISGVINGLLENGGDSLLRRALDRWNKPAVYETLNWLTLHEGAMSDLCCEALQSHTDSVMEWIETHSISSHATFTSLVRITAPNISKISRRDSTVWLKAYRDLDFTNKADSSFICSFLLALGLNNSPPAPLKLISESFKEVHDAARLELLPDSAWMIVEPMLPELSWYSNWDKCERLRRGLISAFVRHGWPTADFKNLVHDNQLFNQLVRSASKVEAGDAIVSKM